MKDTDVKLTQSLRSSIMSLRELDPRERPRERMQDQGPQSLDHYSLISILLGTGRGSKEDALALAKRVLNEMGSLERLANATQNQLCLIRGIGPAKASRLVAAFELAKRAQPDSRSHKELPSQIEPLISIPELISELVRSTWEAESPLLIACSLPSDDFHTRLNPNELHLSHSLQKSVDSAITLSLSSSITDEELYGRWLSTLLLMDEPQPWLLISLDITELKRTECLRGADKLLSLAREIGLRLCGVVVGSLCSADLLIRGLDEQRDSISEENS